jgi:hypothetical protein
MKKQYNILFMEIELLQKKHGSNICFKQHFLVIKKSNKNWVHSIMLIELNKLW